MDASDGREFATPIPRMAWLVARPDGGNLFNNSAFRTEWIVPPSAQFRASHNGG